MSGWDDLRQELDAWQEAGCRATLWWRDDDATAATPALARLLGLAQSARVPLALAAVPLMTEASLVEALGAAPGAVALPHGYAHVDHSAAGEKSGELGPARPLEENLREVALGWRRLSGLFGERALPVLVPPWNRIDPALFPHLPALGLRGLSAWGARPRAFAAPGLRQVNTHLDIIDWRGSRGFVGEGKALAVLVEHLGARRRGEADRDEPSGLLTHHLAHDAAAWDFVARLLAASASHPAARWLAPEAVFPPPPPASRAATSRAAARELP